MKASQPKSQIAFLMPLLWDFEKLQGLRPPFEKVCIQGAYLASQKVSPIHQSQRDI